MRILVLHSGGMDSTTCLYKAKAEGAEVFSLGIDYGQRLAVEMIFANKQCASLGIPRDVIALSWRKPDRPIPIDRTVSEMRASRADRELRGQGKLHRANIAVRPTFAGAAARV
jgi:7-cyano-7-deazaguanine synthase